MFFIVIIICVVSIFSMNNYFVEYAIARSGEGGNREVKEQDVSVRKDEDSQNIIIVNRREANISAKEWEANIKNEKVEIKANDGILLRGTKYIVNKNTKKWAIILHGYRSEPKSVWTIGENFSGRGYNVLIPSMRACSESEGEYIGMGWLDKEDLKCWINLIICENPEAEIILHGSSMGAATVLMVSGDNLPRNVKCIIEDSGYTSVWDIFSSEAKVRFNLPKFPLMNIFRMNVKRQAKYDIKQASSLKQVKNSEIPILFIHGDKDDFVPKYMCDKLYDVTSCKKEKLIIQGAGHIESKYKEPEIYYSTIFKFIDDVCIK